MVSSFSSFPISEKSEVGKGREITPGNLGLDSRRIIMLRRDFEVMRKPEKVVVFGKNKSEFSTYRNLETALLVEDTTFIPWWAIDSYREFSYRGNRWISIYLRNFEPCREYYFRRNRDSVRKQILHGRRKFEFYYNWHRVNIFPIIWNDAEEMWERMYRFEDRYVIGRFYEYGDIRPISVLDYSVVHI